MFSRKVPSYLHARENSVDRLHRPVPDRRVNLEELIKEEDESFSSLCSSDSTMAEETISVCLRLRPYKQQNIVDKTLKITNKTLIVKATVDNNSLNKDLSEKHYTFSDIFDESVEQKQIYNACVRPQMNKYLGNRGATFLTYGTSGSGKTFTLLGSNLQPGIVPRAILQIFSDYGQQISPRPFIKIENESLLLVDDKNVYNEISTVQAIKEEMSHCDVSFSAMKTAVEQDPDCSAPKIPKMDGANSKIFIWISFAEIYNENIYDLLADDSSFLKKRALKVLSNDGNAYIKGLTSLYAKSSEDAYSILQYGMKKATYGSTQINSNSSRSHSIFFITVISFQENQDLTWVTYKFCDLAGSERLKKTGNMGVKGLKEAQRINTSLMVLGRCLDTVHQNQRQRGNQEIVPFRESKLTMLLQSSLLGKEKLTMIVNLLPIEAFYEENLNVLNFSSIAKQIVVQKPVNVQRGRRSSQFAFLVATSNGQNDRYEAEIEKLRDCIFQKDEDMQLLVDENQQMRDENYQLKVDLMEQERQLRNELVQDFEAKREKRAKDFEKRLEQAKIWAEKPLLRKIERLEDKISDLKASLAEADEDYQQLEIESAAYKTQWQAHVSKRAVRRNSF